jgi:two-component system OmpR family sensor kinase
MSLRLRLLVLVAGLAIVALLAVETITYVQLRSFLDDQVNRTVSTSVELIGDSASSGGTIRSADLENLVSTTAGLYVGQTDTHGVIRWHALGVPHGKTPASPPGLVALTPQTDHETSTTRTVGAVSGDLQYRVAIEPVGTSHAILVAAPLDTIDDTLHQLLLVELVVSAIAIAGVLVLGAWLIRVSLRPLTRIERTASAIAAGDLTRRVPDTRPTTEVGRLGRAFNTMISRIDRAFAEQAESERVLRQFVADASHELRTPLTAVRAYSELFDRGAKYHPDDLERAMAGIQREAARMSVLVEDLLLLARLDQHPTMTARNVDLVEIAHLAADASLTIDPAHPVAVTAPDALVVRGDPDALRRVIDNLLGNIRAHTPSGTKASLAVARSADMAVIEVRDNGPGMPEDLVPHAFERFSRADASRSRDAGGSGLGLAIVAAVADAHGGAVELTSSRGDGTCIRITVPALPEPRTDLPERRGQSQR